MPGPVRGLSLPLRSLLGLLEVESNRKVLEVTGELPCPEEFVRLCARKIPGLGLGLGLLPSESGVAIWLDPISSSWMKGLSGTGILLEEPDRFRL